MIDNKYAKFAQYVETGIDPIRRSGIRLLECRDRHVKLFLPLEPNKNHLNIMYAGSLCTLAEMSGGAIFGVCFDYFKYVPIVKKIEVRFVKPGLTDVTLVVSLTEDQVGAILKVLEEKGKSDFTLELEIKDTVGDTVVRATGLYQVRNIPEGLKNPLA